MYSNSLSLYIQIIYLNFKNTKLEFNDCRNALKKMFKITKISYSYFFSRVPVSGFMCSSNRFWLSNLLGES